MNNLTILKDKKILIGVSAGIAIYKILDLISKLRKCGASVKVIMTKNATQLISPLTFETISQNKVTLDLFDQTRGFQIEHIADAKWGDVLLIAPATADIIGKMAHGIADDALTTLCLAFEKDIFISPTMNPAMWNNKILQDNLKILKGKRIKIIEPAVGMTACGDEGVGRLPEPVDLLNILNEYFLCKAPLRGKRVLVTAGPTREFFDPVRCITNPSSGKMGYAIASEAVKLGAEVVLISGPTNIPPIQCSKFLKIHTADEMLKAVVSNIKDADICVFTAAVSDYKPVKTESHKIKKGGENIAIELTKNPDIALEASKQKRKGMIFVGFAAETQNLIENAKEKMKKKAFDLIAVNDVCNKEIGFESDFNEMTLLYKNGEREKLSKSAKSLIAEEIWKRILKLIRK